jgi:SAM-dependent methyltransferase
VATTGSVGKNVLVEATDGETRLDGTSLVDVNESHGPPRLAANAVERIRRTRRHPRPSQFDYLHLRSLLASLTAALGRLDGVEDVLDVYCGTRPYADLLPPGSTTTALDIDDRYGMADVISQDFLPFPDESFDLVMCTEAFFYVADQARGVDEFRRVLRPGGSVLITVPLVWEYDSSILEYRYTGPELAALFDGWHEIEVIENGGFAVSWATLSGRILALAQQRVSHRFGVHALTRPLFGLGYLLINGVGALLHRLEPRFRRPPHTLPMNLLLTARRP